MMKKTEYPIVVIDEQEDQLQELEEAFTKAGKHCTGIKYEPTYDDEPYSGIELLFLDVNLNPGPGKSDMAICATLEGAIKSYISADNGPYVLVFWTTRPELVSVFKEYLKRNNTSQVFIHRPIYVDTLPKDIFQVRPLETLESILNKPIVKLVFSLHKTLLDASTYAFKELIGCVPQTEEWGDNDGYLASLKKVFTKIAITSVGKQNAIIMPDKAIFEVIGREISHQLIKNSREEWKDFLGIDDRKEEEVKNQLYNEWQYRLNTVFHVESYRLDNLDRGAVLTGKKHVFDCLVGVDLYDWYKELYQITKDSDPDFRIIPVAVEISPSCDYAQNNSRLYKYVLGVCRVSKTRPSNNLESGKTPPFKKSSRLLNLPTFLIGGKYYKISLAFNYVIGLRASTAKTLTPLFTLREEMVNRISSMVADYCSRIGTIDVNEA